MEAFITALIGEVTAAELFGVLTSLVPWIGVLILFALAVHFVRRSVSGASKGKAKI